MGLGLLRDLTQQDIVVVDLYLVNFDRRLGSLLQENSDIFRIDIFS